MKKLLILLLVVTGAFLVYKYAFKKDEPKEEAPMPIAVSKHSSAFNQSVSSVLNHYFQMTEGFVNWDERVVNQTSQALKTALDSFSVEELKTDATIYETALFPLDNAKNNTAIIVSATDWNERRRALQDLSDNLRNLLLTVKYDQAIVYWQECPMAFGDGVAGYWLSNKEEVVNPYLGTKDPKYGDTMLNCGETKMKIDFTVADSTAKI